MTLQQLRTFCAVVEETSFRRAAERLYMAQASVSQQIATLEKYYGVLLFHRSGRRCSLTPEGQALYTWAQEALGLLDAIPQKFADMRLLTEGQLNIGASSLAGNYLLPSVLKRYQQTYPRIRLSVQIGHGYEMVERVRIKKVDFAVVGKNLNWTTDPGLVFRPIAVDRLSLIVWPGHPWCGRQLVEPIALQEYLFIHSRQGSAMRSMVEKYFQQENISVAAALDMGNHETIKHAVAEKIGISLISSIAVQRELSSGQLVEVSLARLDIVTRDFVLVSLAQRNESYLERAFIELLTATYQ